MFNSESINNNNDDNNKNNNNKTATMTIIPKKNYKNNSNNDDKNSDNNKNSNYRSRSINFVSFNMHICLRYRWGMGHSTTICLGKKLAKNGKIYHSASFFWVFLRMAKYCTVAITVDAVPLKSNWTFLGFQQKKKVHKNATIFFGWKCLNVLLISEFQYLLLRYVIAIFILTPMHYPSGVMKSNQ